MSDSSGLVFEESHFSKRKLPIVVAAAVVVAGVVVARRLAVTVVATVAAAAAAAGCWQATHTVINKGKGGGGMTPGRGGNR